MRVLAKLRQQESFLSTPSARRATIQAVVDALHKLISIHALREEGDTPTPANCSRISYFYPRPPRGGRRVIISLLLTASQFLSTPSARRATHDLIEDQRSEEISIHALREEGDASPFCGCGRQDVFLSTPSARRATRGRLSTRTSSGPFLSTPSARRATTLMLKARIEKIFLSTPSARRATLLLLGVPADGLISIHALREEGDRPALTALQTGFTFLSTPSARRATGVFLSAVGRAAISIHALREEGDV